MDSHVNKSKLYLYGARGCVHAWMNLPDNTLGAELFVWHSAMELSVSDWSTPPTKQVTFDRLTMQWRLWNTSRLEAIVKLAPLRRGLHTGLSGLTRLYIHHVSRRYTHDACLPKPWWPLPPRQRNIFSRCTLSNSCLLQG